jgi:hypothetical protein
MRTISVPLAVVIRPLLINRKVIRDRGGRNEAMTMKIARRDHEGWRHGLGLLTHCIYRGPRES